MGTCVVCSLPQTHWDITWKDKRSTWGFFVVLLALRKIEGYKIGMTRLIWLEIGRELQLDTGLGPKQTLQLGNVNLKVKIDKLLKHFQDIKAHWQISLLQHFLTFNKNLSSGQSVYRPKYLKQKKQKKTNKISSDR